VGHRQSLHESRQLAVLLRTHNQMPMVWHQTICKQPHWHGVKRVCHHPLKGGVILRFFEYAAPANAAIENVKDHAARRSAWWTRHIASLKQPSRPVKEITLDPFCIPG
jgi:hypothetical protein